MSSDSPPRIRASQLKGTLPVAEQLAGDCVDALHTALGPELLAELRAPLSPIWLPVAYDIALSRAIERVCGPGSDRERSRQVTAQSMDASLLRPFVDGVRRLFGLSPKSLLKTAPRAWSAVYRGAGRCKCVDLGDKGAALDFVAVPREITEADLYLVSIAGGFHAVLDACEVDGDVQVTAVDPVAGSFRLHFTWG